MGRKLGADMDYGFVIADQIQTFSSIVARHIQLNPAFLKHNIFLKEVKKYSTLRKHINLN